MTPGPTHLALVGPTASGKSGLALQLAAELGDIEIVSIDSMQVYRGMDVGTAKATKTERAAVAHHMIDVADPSDDFSVARFQAEARTAVADIEERGLRALLVGGTGLYVQAVIDDLRFPGEDLALRADLQAGTEEPGGVARAYAELQQVDPAAAARIDPHNARRIVRALEVIRLTGQRFSSFGAGIANFGATAFPVLLTGLWLPRAVLAKRIDARVEAMRRGGLVDEVRALRAGSGLARNARQAIGYREALGHLGGTTSLDEAFAMTARRTRSFARRQRMWFRRDPRITWLAAPENPCDVAGALLALWRR
ncbi:MAG: tRNA (adenosine(37)-N6)-dimethylallyltransferase MiaA [Acidimicrobiia bacterium]|nr:tRNA (adenosine(37)-N6)-dimethylallyltransferase MiaA [Acidimicrobiia bacterium]